ncbi:hypothetical protein ABL78_7693 [Leptomonas seymouri]|uniref:BILBO1 N-terminal domain-containing protein n=1 Tax=Leptomonas seymouri TaxID=5684 RepID=A0A0N0P2R9_LEPSE|nr:hypothetical protein ABL78_7693 [Leptomonas seymouri]|eukprot:KPI83279.1 hypothetical protein ABL78_7693 [Leptomonas seymouri]
MVFTILCCADLRGEKVNLEVTLEVAPLSVQDLVSSLTHLFAREEAEMLARQGYATPTPIFQITSTLIYDDVLLQWTKLKSITQLHEYDQLYVFQPQTQWHRDTQQDLPPPRPPVQGAAASIGAARGAPLPVSTSCYMDNAPATITAQSHADMYPAISLQNNTSSRRTPTNPGASSSPEVSGLALRSPVRSQLAEQRREEERLSQRLSSVRSERERLERKAQLEEAKERRRRCLELDRLIQRKEQEIWTHRDALTKAEAEFQHFLAEKQRLIGSASPP